MWWCKNVGISFSRFVTIHEFADGQTDGYFAHGYTVRCITYSRTVKSGQIMLTLPRQRRYKYGSSFVKS